MLTLEGSDTRRRDLSLYKLKLTDLVDHLQQPGRESWNEFF